MSADWGDVDPEDAGENELRLKNGWWLLSAYTLRNGATVSVIIEAERSSTCLLLPEEY